MFSQCLDLYFYSLFFSLTFIQITAGEGRGQFNLYFSIWLCFITSLSMLEKWLVVAGHSSIFQSIASWPNRAPGWIMIITCTASNLVCILDLLKNHKSIQSIEAYSHIAEKYANISTSDWAWLIFTCSISFTTALGFSIVELFRRSESVGIKGECESKFEGICLALLVIIWVPSVVIATTDGGTASDFGNTYFFTWGSAIFVIQTFITWLHDWRSDVHEATRQLRLEYDQCKMNANANINQELPNISERVHSDQRDTASEQ